MARIAHVEILMVDLPPAVTRVDAIQSFVSQETPLVRITDAEARWGRAISYTIGTGGPAVISLLERTLAPRLNRAGGGGDRGPLARSPVSPPMPRRWGAITSLALAAIDTALWDLRCRRAGLPLWRMAGGAKESVPLYTTEGGWLHLPAEALAEDRRDEGQWLCWRQSSRSQAGMQEGPGAAGGCASLWRGLRPHRSTNNQGFDLADRLRGPTMLADCGIHWIEDPCPTTTGASSGARVPSRGPSRWARADIR